MLRRFLWKNRKKPVRKQAPRAGHSLVVESLERRVLLAAFAIPWPNARDLSVSFPSDQAGIGAYSNSLREVFDQVTERRDWQEAVLRAFQSWSVYGNINIGLVPDRGDAFGALGLSTNDPRFGELRIGAFPQPGVLANALPYQPIAGTWSGDVLLNTQVNWFLADWTPGTKVSAPSPNENGPFVDLYSVLLHEAGNSLGLADTHNPRAVMNGTYSGPKGIFHSSDVAAIRRLYGARQDVYEPISNNSLSTATEIQYPTGFNGSSPVSVRGSLNTMSDKDFYRWEPLAGQDRVTVRLWAAGISLVKAKLEVLDAHGQMIAGVNADSIFENNLQLEIGSLADHRTLFIRVARNANDVFAIGDYELELDYRSPEQQPSIIPPQYDDFRDDDFRDDDFGDDDDSVDALFAQIGLMDTEVGRNDTLARAAPLKTPPGFLPGTRFELQSAIGSAADRDLWRFRAPAQVSPIMHINVIPVGLEKINLNVVLLNRRGDRIAAQVTRKGDGGVAMEVIHPTANEGYVLFVQAGADSAIKVGNYVATVNFATDTTQMREVFSGSVAGIQEDLSQLRITKTQLFRFDLAVAGNSANEGVQLTIYNARTGDIAASIATFLGRSGTDYVWLHKGDYYLRATARARTGQPLGPIGFSLLADAISDNQGPNPIDPRQNPTTASGYPIYDWEWVDYYRPVPPVIINFVEPPFAYPWGADYYATYYAGYYNTHLA